MIKFVVKFFVILLLLGGIFWAGYYVGQQPPEKIKRTLRTISEDAIEQVLGREEGRLGLKQEFLEAKVRLLKGKAEMFDGEYGEAAEELEGVLEHLKHAAGIQGGGNLSDASQWAYR